jgi:NACalpha-BTF3-like transcription factor
MVKGDQGERAMAGRMDTARDQEREVTQKKYDQAAVSEKFKKLNEEVAKKKDDEQKREAKLAAVTVKPEDVALVADQLALSNADASRALRMYDGDVVKTFQAAIRGQPLK